MNLPKPSLTLAVLLSSAALAAPAMALNFVVDGTVDANHGSALSTQTTQTNFGNSTVGTTDGANGSELNLGYGRFVGDRLYLFISGNLESNFNKLEIFIDAVPGGQNRLLGTNPNVDFDGLNRMGESGGSGNGLRFDAGFGADYWLSVGGGGGPYQLYANYAELKTAGGGSGNYLGQTGAVSNGVLTGGTNPHGIKVTINNGNTAGVDGGCAAASGAGVATGIEFDIPASAIGNPAGSVRVSVFVNGGGHDFVSNQVLGPLAAGTCNLGEPRSVDFAAQAGDQFFAVPRNAVPMSSPWVMVLMSLGLLGGAAMFLRRRAAA